MASTIPVNIKHAGKTYSLNLEIDAPGLVFKEAVYQLTGIPVDRMKVMVKGGMLKDDADWKKIGAKPSQTFMVIGAAGELPKPPSKPIVFLEDMDDGELAEALAKPVGLTNMGNTCYMNASVQALRAVPELQLALTLPITASQSSPLPPALSSLFNQMGRTTSTITPLGFLQTLRQVNPQFSEMSRGGMGGYAQQDAEECYGQIVNSLRDVPGLDAGSTVTTATPQAAGPGGKNFVDQWMMGTIRRELTCDEAPDEPPSIQTESILKIECNISITTNYMMSGIMNSLDQKLTKTSPTLNREAVYSQKSRLTRLPTYLTVHMVRFAWRADIGKKTKVLRKVKFPLEFDALDLATDDLRSQLLPVSRKLKEVEKARAERRKVRRRSRNSTSASTTTSTGDVEMSDVGAGSGAASGAGGVEGSGAGAGDGAVLPEGELAEEGTYRKKENEEVAALVERYAGGVKGDVGASVSGLYDLVAIVTHKGAAADAGHYIGFVKKSVFHANRNTPDPTTTASSTTTAPSGGAKGYEMDEDDEDWYKFDDDKVSVFPVDKLASLDGGGEDSSAYVLLYRSRVVG